MKVKLLSLLLFSFLFTEGFSQKVERDNWIPFSLGLTYNTVKDAGMSPVTYSGPGIAFSLGYNREREKSINRIAFTLNSGILMSKYYSDTEKGIGNLSGYNLSYIHLRRLKKIMKNRVYWYFGGKFDILANFRTNLQLGNSYSNYEAFASLAPATSLKYDFKIKKRKLYLYLGMSLPVFSYCVRPNYISVFDFTANLDEEDLINDFFDNGKIATINRLFRLNTNLEFAYRMRNNNMLKFSYLWGFYNYKGGKNKVQAATHGIIFTALFNI